jgi:hypothetical protein
VRHTRPRASIWNAGSYGPRWCAVSVARTSTGRPGRHVLSITHQVKHAPPTLLNTRPVGVPEAAERVAAVRDDAGRGWR